MNISPERIEAAARAVAAEMGFEFAADESMVVSDNPRCMQFVRIAIAALNARPKRKPRE